MVRAVHLDDEPVAGADEVTDVACQRDLAPKRYPELAVGELCPKRLLGASGDPPTGKEKDVPKSCRREDPPPSSGGSRSQTPARTFLRTYSSTATSSIHEIPADRQGTDD